MNVLTIRNAVRMDIALEYPVNATAKVGTISARQRTARFQTFVMGMAVVSPTQRSDSNAIVFLVTKETSFAAHSAARS